ncbi:MAG: ABC transporter ATP-binding protein [Oscillospiraceae bacterium]|nr:ABC transporter ATP-binding protein [Oscillospiraceae bacterium]
MTPALVIKDVEKTFNPGTITENHVLKGVNLVLEEGDYVTVIGGNGAGKSTMLNSIAGVFPIDEGEIYIGEKNVTNLPEHKRAVHLGRVFQDPMVGTAAAMTIAENLSLALHRGEKRGLTKAISEKEKEFFRTQLKQLDLDLENRLDDTIGLLSGGQRQAITLLMATIKKPDLLLLDEHTAALDPKTAEKVLQLTDTIVKENNLTTIMITHNMRDAISHGNRLIMMNNGRVVYDVKGEEKQKLTVEALLEKFTQSYRESTFTDRMILG